MSGVTRDEFMEWLRAHGLDPKNVREVAFTRMSVLDYLPVHMRVEEYALDQEGHKHVDAEGDVAMNVRYVPLKHLP